MKAIRLVVGLGNPGREYEKHRHNAGFWWVAAATDLYPAQMKLESRFQGILGRASVITHHPGLRNKTKAELPPKGLLGYPSDERSSQSPLKPERTSTHQGLLGDSRDDQAYGGLLGNAPRRRASGLPGFSTAAKEIFFFLPQTFMNASGRAVGAVSHFYKIPPDEILVVHDELDLPPGESRLKLGGGHAGHNGLKDIVSVLGTPDFWRLRIGIGHPGTREEVVNYVLNKPPESELSLVEEVIHQSLQGLPFLAQGLYPEAQARINIRRKSA